MMQVTSCMEEQDGGNVVKRLSVPVGLEELMTGLTKEVLQKKPKDIYNFASDHFAHLLALRDNGNYQQAPTKSITYASKENVERALLNGKTSSTKSSDGTPTKLSRQVSIRAGSPTRKNGPKLKRSGTPKHENYNNKEAKLKDKQDSKKPVSSRRQTPGSKSKFDNLEPVQEDALKMLTKRQSLSRRSTDRKNKTDSENSRDSKRSSSEESEKKKRPSRDASLNKKTAEKKMQSGDSKEAKDKKNGQEKLKRKKEENKKNSTDTKTANDAEKAQAVSTFGLQHSSEIYDTIIPTETSEEIFKDQSKAPIKALGLQHSGEIHDVSISTEISEQSSKDEPNSPVKVRGLRNNGEIHGTVISTEISEQSSKAQSNPPVKSLGLQHSGESHDTVIATEIAEESSKDQSNPPVKVLGLQHSGEVHDTIIPTEESFKHQPKDKNENVKDALREKSILKSSSIEESTTGIKDGRLTVTPPKILKGVQTSPDDFDVPTTLVVPTLATTSLNGRKSPAESISVTEQTDKSKTEDLHEDSETGETVSSSKDEDENKDVSLTKYDSSVLRKELEQVEEESKLNSFTSSYNPYKLKQEIRNASKELEEEHGAGSAHLSADEMLKPLKEDEKVIRDSIEGTEQELSKEKEMEDYYAKEINHEEAKAQTVDVTLLQQPKVSGQLENNKLQLLHAQTAISEGSTTGSAEGTSLDNKEMPEEETIEDNELQQSLTVPDTKTPVLLGSTSRLQHSGELHDQIIPNESDENKSATTADVAPVATSEKTPTALESISGLQHSGELHDQVIPKESDENKGATTADVEPVATSEKTPTALESISSLQHSGELHDQVIPKESVENKGATTADVEPVATSEKTPTALESISSLQHSGELHDQVIPKESVEIKSATTTDVKPVAASEKTPTALESISSLQHSGELHDQVIPKESDENKSTTTADVEPVAISETTPTSLESISGLQHSGELHDQVIPKESDDNKSATTADVEPAATSEKTPTSLESISGLQHSGELHDHVIPKETDENKSATTADVEPVATSEKTPTSLESISGLQHSGELHDQVIPKEFDENKSATGADVEPVATLEKTSPALESISSLQHSGELHDQVIPKESDENKNAATADVEPVATSEKTPALESISGLQHSGELHDQVIPKEFDENKSATGADVEPVATLEKTSPALESISSLQHSGELHDQVIPKESDENKSDTAADVEPVATSEKTPPALESISGLQNSGELHDQLIPTEPSKDQTGRSELDITKSPVALQAMVGLQHSGELHDQLISKENDENADAGELQDELLIPKANGEEEVQKSRVLDLQHSGELHDNLILKPINGVDETGKSPDLKQVRKLQSDEIPEISHENIEDKKELERSSEGSTGSVIAPSENVKKQSKVGDVEISKQEIDETAAKLTVGETIAQAASKIQAGVRGYLTRKLYKNKTPSKDASTNNQIESANKLSDKEVQDALTQLDILPVPSESPHISRHKREVADIDLGDIRMEDSSGQKDKLSRSKTVHAVEKEKSLIPNLFKSLSVTDSALSKTLDDDEDKLHDSTEESVSLEHTEDLGIGSEKSAMLHSDTIIKNLEEQQSPKESSTASLEHSGELHDTVTPKESGTTEGKSSLEVKSEEDQSKVLGNGKSAGELETTSKESVPDMMHHDSSISEDGPQASHKSILLKTDPLQHSVPKELEESQIKKSIHKLDNKDSLQMDNVEKKIETEALQHSGELHDILIPKEASKEIQDEHKVLKDDLQHSGEMHDLLIPNQSEEGRKDKIEQVTEMGKEFNKSLQEVNDDKDLKIKNLQHSGDDHDILVPTENENIREYEKNAGLHVLETPKSISASLETDKKLVDDSGQRTANGLSTEIQGISKEIQYGKDNLQHSGQLHDLQPNEVKEPLCEAEDIEDLRAAGIEDSDKIADKESQELQDDKIVVKNMLQHSGELHDVLIAKDAEEISQKLNNGEKDENNFQHTAVQNDFSVPTETRNISEKIQEDKTLPRDSTQHSGELHDLLVPKEIEESLQKAQDIEDLREKSIQVSDTHSDKVPQELQDGKALTKEALEHSGELHDLLIPKHMEASIQKLQDNNSNKENLEHSGELHDILVPKAIEEISQELKNNIQSKKKDIQDDLMRDLRSTKIEDGVPRPATGDIRSIPPSPEEQQEDNQQSKKKDIQEKVTDYLMRGLQHTEVEDDKAGATTDDTKSTTSSADDQQEDNQQAKKKDIQEKVKDDLIVDLYHTEAEDVLEGGTTDDTKSTEPSPDDQQKDINKKLNNMKSNEADNTIKQSTSHDIQSDNVDSKTFAKQESGLASINGLQHSGELHDLILPQNDISMNSEVEKEKLHTEEEIQLSPASTTSSTSVNDLQKVTSTDVIQHSGEMHDILIPQENLTKTDTNNESFVDSPETAVEDNQSPKENNEKEKTTAVLDEHASGNTTATSFEKDSKRQKAVGLQHAEELHDTLITEQTKKDFQDEGTKDDSKPLALNQVQNVEVAKVECSGSENSLNQPYTPSVLAKSPELEDKEAITSATPSFDNQHNIAPTSSETDTVPFPLKDAQKETESAVISLGAITEPLHNELQTNTEHVEPMIKCTQQPVSAEVTNTDKQLSDVPAEEENLLVSKTNSQNEETSQIKEVKPLSAATKTDKDEQEPSSQDNSAEMKAVGKQIDKFTKENFGGKIVDDTVNNIIDKKSAKELLQTREDTSRNSQGSVENNSVKHIEDQILKNDEIDSISDGTILQQPLEHSQPSHDLDIAKETDDRKLDMVKNGKEIETLKSHEVKERDTEEERAQSKDNICQKNVEVESNKTEDTQNKKEVITQNTLSSDSEKEMSVGEQMENVNVENISVEEDHNNLPNETSLQNDNDLNKSFEMSKLQNELKEAANQEINDEAENVDKINIISNKPQKMVEKESTTSAETGEENRKNNEDKPKDEENSKTSFDVSKLHSELKETQKETEKGKTKENGESSACRKIVDDEKFKEITFPDSEEGKADQQEQNLTVLEENAKLAETNEEDRKTNEDKPKDGKHSKTSFDISKLRAGLEEAERLTENIDHTGLKAEGSSPKVEQNIEEEKSSRSKTSFDISKLHSELKETQKEKGEDEIKKNERGYDGTKVVGDEKFKETTVSESEEERADQKDKKLNDLEARAKSAETKKEDRKNNEDKPKDGKNSKTSFDISKLRAELEKAEDIGHGVLDAEESSPKLEQNTEAKKSGSNAPFDSSKLHSELEETQKETEKDETEENGRRYDGKKVVGDEKFKETTVPESEKEKADQKDQKLNILEESAKSAETNEEDCHKEDRQNSKDKPKNEKIFKPSSDISKLRAELEEAENEIEDIDHAVLEAQGSSPKLKQNVKEEKSGLSNTPFDISKLHSELEGTRKETKKDETIENGGSYVDKKVVGKEKFKENTALESEKARADKKDQKLNVLKESAKSAETNEDYHEEDRKNNEDKPKDEKIFKTSFDISKLRAELEAAENEIEDIDHAVLEAQGSSKKLKQNIEEEKSDLSNTSFDISKLHSELEGKQKKTEKDEIEENGGSYDDQKVVGNEKFKETTALESEKQRADQKDHNLNALEESTKSAETIQEDYHEEDLKNKEDKPKDGKNSKTSFDISKLRAELEEAEKEIEDIGHSVLDAQESTPKLKQNIEENKSGSNAQFDILKLHSELEGTQKETEKDETEENGGSYDGKKVDEKFKETSALESEEERADQKDQKLNVLEESAKSAETNDEDYHEEDLKNKEDTPKDGKNPKTSFDISKLRAELEETEKEIEDIGHSVLDAQGSSPKLKQNIEEQKSGLSNTSFDISKLHSELEGQQKETEKDETEEKGGADGAVGDEKFKETTVLENENERADQKDQKLNVLEGSAKSVETIQENYHEEDLKNNENNPKDGKISKTSFDISKLRAELDEAEKQIEGIDHAVLEAKGSTPKLKQNIGENKSDSNTPFDITKLHSELEEAQKEIEKDKTEENGGSHDGRKIVGDEKLRETTTPKTIEGKAKKEPKKDKTEEVGGSYNNTEILGKERFSKVEEVAKETDKDKNESVVDNPATLDESETNIEEDALKSNDQKSIVVEKTFSKHAAGEKTSPNISILGSELEAVGGEKEDTVDDLKRINHRDGVQETVAEKHVQALLTKGENEIEAANFPTKKNQRVVDEKKKDKTTILAGTKENGEVDKASKQQEDNVLGSNASTEMTTTSNAEVSDKVEGGAFSKIDKQGKPDENHTLKTASNEEENIGTKANDVSGKKSLITSKPFDISQLRYELEPVDALKAGEPDKSVLPNIPVKIHQDSISHPKTFDISNLHSELNEVENQMEDRNEASADKVLASKEVEMDSKEKTKEEVPLNKNVEEILKVEPTDASESKTFLVNYNTQKPEKKDEERDSDENKSSNKGINNMKKIQSVDISDSKTLITDDENKQDSKENAETKDIAADRPKSKVVIANSATIQESKEDNRRQYIEKQKPTNEDVIESAKLKLSDHSELKTKSIDGKDEPESKEADHMEDHILFSADLVDHPESTSRITNDKNRQNLEADNGIQKSINKGVSATFKDEPALEVPLMHSQNEQDAIEHEDEKEKISVYEGETGSSDHMQSKILLPGSKNIESTEQDNGAQPLSKAHVGELEKPKTADHPKSETLSKNKENSQVSKEENRMDAQIMPPEAKIDSEEKQVISIPLTDLNATPLLNNIPAPVQSPDRNPQNSLPDESLANIYESAPTRPVTSDITPNISSNQNIQIPSENLHKQVQDIEQINKPDIESDENLALASKNVNRDANVQKISETKHVTKTDNSMKGNDENDQQNKMETATDKTVHTNQSLGESSNNEETKSVNSEQIISDDNKIRVEEDLERPVSMSSTTSADSVATVIALSPRERSAERRDSLVRSNSSEKSEDSKTDTQVCKVSTLTKHESQEQNKDADGCKKHENGKTEKSAKEAAASILNMAKLKSEIEEQESENLKHKPIESVLTKSDQENENLSTSLKVNNANNENNEKISTKENNIKKIRDVQVSSNETLAHDTSSFEAGATLDNGISKNDNVDNHDCQQLRESPELGKYAAATTIQSNYRGYRVRRDLGNHNLNSFQTAAEISDKKEEKHSRINCPDINEHIKETLLQHIYNEGADKILPEVTSTAEKDSLSENSDTNSKASNQQLITNVLGKEDKADRNIKHIISGGESVTHISPVCADASSNFQKLGEIGDDRNEKDPKMVNQVPESNTAGSTTDEEISASERDSKISNKSSGDFPKSVMGETTTTETTSEKLTDSRIPSEDLVDLQKSELSEDVKTGDSSSSKTIDEAGTTTPLLEQQAEQASNSKSFAKEEGKGKDAVSAESPKRIPLSELDDKKLEKINTQSFHTENKNIEIVPHEIATAPPLHLLEHEYDNVSTSQMANSFNNDVAAITVPSKRATAPPLALLEDVNNQPAVTKVRDHLLQSSSKNTGESSPPEEAIKSVEPTQNLLIPKKIEEENQSSALESKSQENVSKLPYSNKKTENVSTPTTSDGEQSSKKMESKNIESKYVDMLVSPRFNGNPAAAVPKALDVVLDQQLAIATPNAGERQESIDSEGPEYIHIPLKGSIEHPSKETSNSGLQHSGELHDTINAPLLNLKQEEPRKELLLDNKSIPEEGCKIAVVDDFSSSKYDLVKGDVSPRAQKEEKHAVPKALGVVLDQQLAIATPKAEQKQETNKSERPEYIHIPLKSFDGASTSDLQHTGEIHDKISISPLDLNPEDAAQKSYNLEVKTEPKNVANIQDANITASATDDFTSSKYDFIENEISPRVRKEVKGAIPKALGAILDQQLAITTPRAEEEKERRKSKEPEYIYIPLKDSEETSSGLQHSGEFHDTIPIPLSETKPVTKEDTLEKPVASAQKQEIEASTENVLCNASGEWDSSKYDLVKGGTNPMIRKEQEGAVPKVLGTVLDQQLAITAPLGKSKETENELIHPKYTHIPLKDTNELPTSKEDNLNNGFQSDDTNSSFRGRTLTNGLDEEDFSDSTQGMELTNKVHHQDINKSPSFREDKNKSATLQEKQLTEEHQGQQIDNLAIPEKKEPTHLVSGVDLCKSLPLQEKDNISTSVFNAEQLTNGHYPTTQFLIKEDLHNGHQGGRENIPLKSQSQKREESESKPLILDPQLQNMPKSSLGDSATEHMKSSLSPVNSSLDVSIPPTLVLNHKAEDLRKPKVEEPQLERTLVAKLSATDVKHNQDTATLDYASKKESLSNVSPSPGQPFPNRLTDNTVLLLPSERDQRNSPSFDQPPQHLQNGIPTFRLQLRFSPSPTQNMERRSNSETGNDTTTIDGNENLNSAREDRSVQSESPPIVIQSTQISDNTIPLAVQLNQPPAGAAVLTSPTPNDDDDDDAGDRPAAHASEKGASTKVEAGKNRAHFRTSMETDKRKNATIKEKNMEEVAATKIQAGFRGYQVRKQLKLKNGGVESVRRSLRRKSSGKLRGSEKVSQKSSSNPSDLEEKSATKIQAGIRGFLVRRRQQKKGKNSTTPESS